MVLHKWINIKQYPILPSAIDRLFKQIRPDEVNIGRLDKNPGRRKHLYFGSVRTLPWGNWLTSEIVSIDLYSRCSFSIIASMQYMNEWTTKLHEVHFPWNKMCQQCFPQINVQVQNFHERDCTSVFILVCWCLTTDSEDIYVSMVCFWWNFVGTVKTEVTANVSEDF